MIDARWLGLGAFVLLLPVSIENPAARDSTVGGGETRVSIAGSLGSYAVIDRGCEGQVLRTHPHEFSEVAGEVHHRFPSGATVGVRGGAVKDRKKQEVFVETSPYYPAYSETIPASVHDVTYVNPSVGFDLRSFGLGVGWVGPRGRFGGDYIPFSAHLRAGPWDGTYFKISVMEAVPLYAGGGLAEMGMGMHPTRNWDFYWGLSAAPYDGPGLAAKVDYRVRENLALMFRGRLGNAGSENQSAVGLGVMYVSTPPRQPERWDKRSRPGTIESSWGLAKRPREEKTKVERERKLPKPQGPPEYGTYQHVDSLPMLLEKTSCRLPAAESDTSATATLAALIGEDGRVREVRVIRSSPLTDMAATECVRQWLFRPAMYRGWPVAYWLTVPVTFEREP